MILLDYETDNGTRGLGDILISTPIIQALAEKYSTRIDVVLRKEAQVLLHNNPYISDIYETADNLTPKLHLIMGMKLEDYGNLRNRQPRVDSIAELFGVCAVSKLPQLYYPEQKKILNSIGVSIESKSDMRRWSYDYLIKLTELVDAEWYVFGLTHVELPNNIHNHLGKLSLSETLNEVSKMEKILTVDSFFSHFAAALNIPSVIIYTTIPSEWRMKYYPYAKAIQSPQDCSPCLDRQLGVPELCKQAIVKPCVKALIPEFIVEKLNPYH